MIFLLDDCILINSVKAWDKKDVDNHIKKMEFMQK